METTSKPRILVAEDEFLIALMLSDALEDLGCEVVGPANRVPIALEIAGQQHLDGALLDVNLAGAKIFPVVDVLTERRVPVILCTAYDSAGELPPPYDALPAIGKPFDTDVLRAAVTTEILTRAGRLPDPA